LWPLAVEVIHHSSEPPNPWEGYKRCLTLDQTLGKSITHLCILQDDVTVAENFAPALEQIAASNPDTPVCLFLARLPRRTSVEATRALKDGRRYVDLHFRDFCPVVGMLWPVEKARHLMEWQKTARFPGKLPPRSDDAVVGHWMRHSKQTIRACVPSIVQHPDMEPSLIGRKPAWGKDSGRVALHLAEDALDYLW
jgi:GR25 family glycosyltransferase involved in LPS biosynthesis